MDVFLIWNVFLNDEEDDNWEIVPPREEHLKINNFFENVVLFYSLTGNNKSMYYLFFIFYDIYDCILFYYRF